MERDWTYFSNFLEISVSSIVTAIKLNLLEGYVYVVGYWADDWKSHPIKWIIPITSHPQTRAGQEVTGKSWLGDTGRMDAAPLPGVRGWLRRRIRALHTFQFFLPLSESETLKHAFTFHHHQIIFLKLACARGSVSFHSVQIFFSLPLCLLGLFAIYWLTFSLWLPTVNTVPTHSIKDFAFIQKWYPIGEDALCPEAAFLIHRLGSHLLDRRNLSYSEAPHNLCPENIKQ